MTNSYQILRESADSPYLIVDNPENLRTGDLKFRWRDREVFYGGGVMLINLALNLREKGHTITHVGIYPNPGFTDYDESMLPFYSNMAAYSLNSPTLTRKTAAASIYNMAPFFIEDFTANVDGVDVTFRRNGAVQADSLTQSQKGILMSSLPEAG